MKQRLTMKTQLLLGVFGLVAMMVGCAAPSVGEDGRKSSSSKMRTDGWPESSNIEDRRNDPPGTEYPNEPATPNEPVDTSPGSLADQAGINDIGKNNGAGGNSSQNNNDQNNEQANGGDGEEGVDDGDGEGAEADDGDGDGEEGVDDGDSEGAEADDGGGDGGGDE
jgi:hypothetical protein